MKHAAVCVLRGVGQVSLGRDRVENPFEGTVWSERNRGNPHHEHTAYLELVISLRADGLKRKDCFFGRGWESLGGRLAEQENRCGIVPGSAKQS